MRNFQTEEDHQDMWVLKKKAGLQDIEGEGVQVNDTQFRDGNLEFPLETVLSINTRGWQIVSPNLYM